MTEATITLEQERNDFERRFRYLTDSGIMKALYEEGKNHEGLNDETLWQYHGRQFEGLSVVLLDVRKPRITEEGLETKHVRVVFDGFSLRIAGKSSTVFSMPVDSDIQVETINRIQDAIERCFREPETTFIPTADLYSSD